jgi:hypothetical protein
MSSTGCEHTHNGTTCKKCRRAYYNSIVVKKKKAAEDEEHASVEELVIGKQNLSGNKLLIWKSKFLQTLKRKLRSRALTRKIAWKAFEKVFPKDQESKEFDECVKKIRNNWVPFHHCSGYTIYGIDMFYELKIPKFPSDPVAPVTPVNPVAPVTPVNPVAPVTPVNPVAPVTPVNPVAPAYHLCTNCEKNCVAGVNFYEKKA